MKSYYLDLTQPLQFVRGGKFTGDKGWVHDRRLPTDYELIIGIEGCLYLTIGEELVTIKENDVCLVPPNVVHHGSKSLTEETSFFWLHFLTYASNNVTNTVEIPLLSHLDNVDSIILHTKLLLDKDMSNASQLNLDYIMSLIMIEVDNKLNFKQTIYNNLVNQAEEYIRINIYKNLSVTDVATHLHYSGDYISNAFREYYGYSLKKYILRQEIIEIKNLLITTDLTIKEIARKFNFNDEKYLMRIFKKHEDITISKYRKSFVKMKLNSDSVSE